MSKRSFQVITDNDRRNTSWQKKSDHARTAQYSPSKQSDLPKGSKRRPQAGKDSGEAEG